MLPRKMVDKGMVHELNKWGNDGADELAGIARDSYVVPAKISRDQRVRNLVAILVHKLLANLFKTRNDCREIRRGKFYRPCRPSIN